MLRKLTIHITAFLLAFTFIGGLSLLDASLGLSNTVFAQEIVTQLLDGVGATAFGLIGNAILSLMGALLGMAGLLLNEAVNITVLGMGQVLSGGGTVGIEVAWTVLRDIANIGFVFVLLFIGIATILRYSKYGYQQLLIYLVIAALLVNFSLFFTRIVIDMANLMAAEAIQLIHLEGQNCGENRGALETMRDGATGYICLNDGLSGALMDQLNLTSLYNASSLGGGASSVFFDGDANNTLNVFIVTAAGSLFILITTFVFVTAAFLLIIRFVVLVFLMILSPLAFAGMVLPATRGRAQKWFQTLFAQAFFAPAFFILIWAVLQVLNGIGQSGAIGGTTIGSAVQNRTFAAALLGHGEASGILINFGIAIGLIVAALILSKKLANFGSFGLVSVASRTAGNVAFGGTGQLFRNTLGRLSSKIAKSSALSDRAIGDKGNFVTRNASRLALRGARTGAKSSFDARNVGKWSKNKDIEAGNGIKGGFDDVKKEKGEREQTFAEKTAENTTAAREAAKRDDAGISEKGKQYREQINTQNEAGGEMSRLREAGRTNSAAYVKAQQSYQKASGEAASLRKQIEEEGFSIEESQKDLESEKNRKQEEYASRLESGPSFDIQAKFPLLIFNSKAENKEYAAGIRKNMKKSKEERAQEKLRDMVAKEIKENAKKNDE